MNEESEARARRGCAAHGAKFYRVLGPRDEDRVFVTTRKEAGRVAGRIARRYPFATAGRIQIHRVILTARLPAKKLALALLNNDESAFASVVRVSSSVASVVRVR